MVLNGVIGHLPFVVLNGTLNGNLNGFQYPSITIQPMVLSDIYMVKWMVLGGNYYSVGNH